MQHFFHQQYRFVFVFLSSYTVFVVLLHAQPNLELNLDSCSLDALLMEIMRSHDCGICFLSYMSSISIWSLYIVYKIHVFLSRSLHLYRYIYIYIWDCSRTPPIFSHLLTRTGFIIVASFCIVVMLLSVEMVSKWVNVPTGRREKNIMSDTQFAMSCWKKQHGTCW